MGIFKKGKPQPPLVITHYDPPFQRIVVSESVPMSPFEQAEKANNALQRAVIDALHAGIAPNDLVKYRNAADKTFRSLHNNRRDEEKLTKQLELILREKGGGR